MRPTFFAFLPLRCSHEVPTRHLINVDKGGGGIQKQLPPPISGGAARFNRRRRHAAKAELHSPKGLGIRHSAGLDDTQPSPPPRSSGTKFSRVRTTPTAYPTTRGHAAQEAPPVFALALSSIFSPFLRPSVGPAAPEAGRAEPFAAAVARARLTTASSGGGGGAPESEGAQGRERGKRRVADQRRRSPQIADVFSTLQFAESQRIKQRNRSSAIKDSDIGLDPKENLLTAERLLLPPEFK